jgi:hypothetical protein
MKTASWGRGTRAGGDNSDPGKHREPHGQLGELDDAPGGGGPSATADAVAEWQQAVSTGDVAAQRTIIKRVFPKLTLCNSQGRGDYSAHRIALDGLEQTAT